MSVYKLVGVEAGRRLRDQHRAIVAAASLSRSPKSFAVASLSHIQTRCCRYIALTLSRKRHLDPAAQRSGSSDAPGSSALCESEAAATKRPVGTEINATLWRWLVFD